MKINRIKINRFGKLAGEEISFDSGLNIVYGPNESGKSTLYGFIMNMLFGMIRSRGRASKTDDFTRFEPKDIPLEYSGSMEFECGGKDFVLGRDFAAGKRKDTLVSKSDMEALSVEDGDLDMLLDGVSRYVYSNTQSIPQEGAADREFLKAALTDRYSSMNSDREYDNVISRSAEEISARRKQLEAQSRSIIKEREEAAGKIRSQMAYVDSEIELLKGKLADAQVKKQNTERTLALRRARIEEKQRRNSLSGNAGRYSRTESQNKRRAGERRGDNRRENIENMSERSGVSILTVIGILLIAAAGVYFALQYFLFAADITRTLLLTLAGGVSGVICFVLSAIIKNAKQMRFESRYEEYGDYGDDAEEYFDDGRDSDLNDEEYRIYKEELKRAEEDRLLINYMRDTLRQKEASRQRLAAQYENAAAKSAELSDIETKIEGLNLAQKTVEDIAGRARSKYEKVFREYAARIFEYISSDEGRRLVFDGDGEPALAQDSIHIPFWQCSKGTRDIIEFSIRLAAADILEGEEKMPVLIDDAFVSCDDDRLKRMMLFLKNIKRQVILFTCHTRESDTLDELGIKYNKVKWTGAAQ